jgi:predicted dehydrogenase
MWGTAQPQPTLDRQGNGPRRRVVGIVMNGVTGRMGTNQHLIRSVLAIRQAGGIRLSDGEIIWPEPVLVGRNEHRLRELAGRHGLDRWTTNLAEALADDQCTMYFDAQATAARAEAVEEAIAAGKHVYCEKPLAADLPTALRLARLARDAGVKHGVVQDKLFLPGLLKLNELVQAGFFGRILSVRGDFGYWVFEGAVPSPQRPSWNYRKEEGGGIIVDMFSHWRYVINNIFGPIRSVFTLAVTHIPVRADESGAAYDCTAEDAAYAIFELDGGAIVQMNSSWCTRVYRDELLELHVDGTLGSAVAGLRSCRIQHHAGTPMASWGPDLPNPVRFREGWQEVPDRAVYDNGFKVQWEWFLRHVVRDEPFPWDFLEGAKGIQLAELATQSWRQRQMVPVPELSL